MIYKQKFSVIIEMSEFFYIYFIKRDFKKELSYEDGKRIFEPFINCFASFLLEIDINVEDKI